MFEDLIELGKYIVRSDEKYLYLRFPNRFGMLIMKPYEKYSILLMKWWGKNCNPVKHEFLLTLNKPFLFVNFALTAEEVIRIANETMTWEKKK